MLDLMRRRLCDAMANKQLLSCTEGPSGPHRMLTQKGIDSMTRLGILSKPSRAFAVRNHIPIADRTPFELMRKLEKDGFAWKQWKPPKSRNRLDAIQDLYVNGEVNEWYSHARIDQLGPYLECLAQSADLFDAGCPCIPMFREVGVYKQILSGDYSACVPALEDKEELDVDGDGVADVGPLSLSRRRT